MIAVAIAAAGWAGVMTGLAGSVVLSVTGFRAQWRPDRVRRGQLVTAVTFMLTGAVVAMAALETALLTDSFAVRYVAENHARSSPLLFTITSAWSALEGSLVLWVLVLAGYTAVVLRQVRDTSDRLGAGALGVLGLVGVFFFALIAAAANPFEVLATAPADGPGPNPLLRDHLMVAFHPPMLYLGYVGFTVPFAFGMSALLLRRRGVDWLRRSRRANLVAWTFLSGGLVLGGWWSYEVLGWGGYWAWDPVENAALIPWLVATAFIHSAVVQVKRGMLQAWNFVLVIATFALTILGTFLTRSSVVASVHSFTQSAVGPALLGFFLFVVGGGFLLFAARGHRLASPPRPESLAGREGVFLINNLLLTLFAFVVLTGTVYPVLVEALTGDQVSVGRPFFDTMAAPLSFGLLLAMGIGPFTPYRHASAGLLWRRLRVPLVAAALVVAALAVAGLRAGATLGVIFFAVWVLVAAVVELRRTAGAWRPDRLGQVLTSRRPYWGGQLAHLGIALVAVVIAVSGSQATRATVTLDRGATASFAGYAVTYAGSETHQAPDRTSTDAHIEFRVDGRLVRLAEPAVSSFPGQAQSVGTPTVWTRTTGDIYVALGQLTPERITLNLYAYPLMAWLWLGGLLAMAGGAWALSGRRARTPLSRPEPEPADA